MKHLTRSGFGIFTIIMLFFILIIMIPTVFYYQDAKATQTASQHYSEYVKAYYATDTEAMQLKQQIIDLSEEKRSSFYEDHHMIVQNDEVIYEIAIDDTSVLQVILQIHDNSVLIKQWIVKGREIS